MQHPMNVCLENHPTILSFAHLVVGSAGLDGSSAGAWRQQRKEICVACLHPVRCARERPGQLQLIARWREQHKNEMSKV
jgi:hypothetical protein